MSSTACVFLDGNLLKLDILGHDDPTMIRMLEDLTGISARDVPLDQRDVMSLFASTKALKIEPEDIGGCKLGCLGIPEFGTDFAMQMLIDTKPKYFSDLIRIAGLSRVQIAVEMVALPSWINTWALPSHTSVP